jgi:uncharacterized protein YndB with AHSA1/START domain
MTDQVPPMYEQQVRIAASPETVFGLLSDGRQMTRWMGLNNTMVPEPGGAVRIDVNGRDVAAGHVVVIEPPTRLVFTWGWENSELLPPGASTVEITLVADGDHTVLTLVHRDCPPEMLAGHATGWKHYLERLRVASTGDAGTDPWTDPNAPRD